MKMYSNSYEKFLYEKTEEYRNNWSKAITEIEKLSSEQILLDRNEIQLDIIKNQKIEDFHPALRNIINFCRLLKPGYKKQKTLKTKQSCRHKKHRDNMGPHFKKPAYLSVKY